MRCYVGHKNIVTFMKFVNGMENSICIYLSAVLVGICCEANLSEPLYSEISKERFKFQFSVQSISTCCKVIKGDDAVSATGYSFRDKSDAIESAALAMIDLLMYQHGIRSTLYSDLVFIKDWPAYRHTSKNLKATCAAVLDITSDISSLIDGIAKCGNLCEVEKSRFSARAGDCSEAGGLGALDAVLNDCIAELQSTHQSLSDRISEYTEGLRWRCHSHRFYHGGYYEAVYNLHRDLDIQIECIGTLKVTLEKVCEKSGFSCETLSPRRVSKDSYITEMVLFKHCDSVELEKRVVISSAKFSNIHQCQQDAIYRAISTLCEAESLKIIDAGYLDLRDMKKENCTFKHEVPLLCNIVAKIKIILEDGYKNIDVLSQQYYRHLKDSKFSKDIRLLLADCICDFIHIIKCLGEEARKMEVYSSNLAFHGEDART